MRYTVLTQMTGAALFAVLAMPAQTIAQEEQAHRAERPPHYAVTDLGTLGGTYSNSYGVNDLGWVAGGAATADQTNGLAQTAFLWYGGGPLVDLGTLDGPTKCPACSSEASGPNFWGEAAIISETSKTDPNGEDFCQFGTHRQCLSAIWKNGAMKALPNLPGGNNGQTYWINDRGQIAGLAENGIRDSTCATATPFQVLRFEATVWEPNGEIRELQPLSGDTVGFAFAINDSGQAVGVSGLCSNTSAPPVSAASLEPHAVLWERDRSAIDLGSLGGTYNVPASINNRGEVAGASQSSKDGNVHAFLWNRETGIQDLGIFPGSFLTAVPCCNNINDRGEVVGVSIDANGPRALLWLHKKMYDLNTLIPKNSPWYLQFPSSINDAGEITGIGLIGGNIHAFVAIACDRDHRGAEACRHLEGIGGEADETAERPQPVLSESARQQLQQRLGSRNWVGNP